MVTANAEDVAHGSVSAHTRPRGRAGGLIIAALLTVIAIECIYAAKTYRRTDDLAAQVRTGPSGDRIFALHRLANRDDASYITPDLIQDIWKSSDKRLTEFTMILSMRKFGFDNLYRRFFSQVRDPELARRCRLFYDPRKTPSQVQQCLLLDAP